MVVLTFGHRAWRNCSPATQASFAGERPNSRIEKAWFQRSWTLLQILHQPILSEKVNTARLSSLGL